MVQRNLNLAKLKGRYLFPEIARRKQELLEKEPNAKIISLAKGDTTEPITTAVINAMREKVDLLGTEEGYTGYGADQGDELLRRRIIDDFYPNKFATDEVFISDGSKPAIGRLQILFGSSATVAVQDPTYPVFIATSVITGQTGGWLSEKQQYEGIVPLPCTPENNFFPDLSSTERADLIYFCSPNNPTGSVPTYEQLQNLVDWARENRSIIIYDTAYAGYIRDSSLPRTIYEIEGAKECAIETGSFSKLIGFTGVRLGWTIIPKELTYDDGKSVIDDWRQISSVFFNGANNIAQAGGATALSLFALLEARGLTDFYMKNTSHLRTTLNGLGLKVYGGDNAPFLWVHYPGRSSWDVFDEILNKAHLLTTPGIGFGPRGEEFIRFSAFGHREQIAEACFRLREM